MKTVPIPMTRDQLLEALETMLEHIRQGDSFEGSVQYTMPYDEHEKRVDGADFMVLATYRVGNLQGQGGTRLIGRLR